MSEAPLQHETPVEESTAKPTADVLGLLGQDVLAAMDKLSWALKAASDGVSNRQAQGGQKPTVGGHRPNSREMRDMYKEEGKRLREFNKLTNRGENSQLLGFITEVFVSFDIFWVYQGPVFRFRLRPGEVVISRQSDQQLPAINKVTTWFKEQEGEHVPPVHTYWNPPRVVGYSAFVTLS